MKEIDISEIERLLVNYDKTEQPVIIIRNGQPVAALFTVEDVDIESFNLTTNPMFKNIINKPQKNQK